MHDKLLRVVGGRCCFGHHHLMASAAPAGALLGALQRAPEAYERAAVQRTAPEARGSPGTGMSWACRAGAGCVRQHTGCSPQPGVCVFACRACVPSPSGRTTRCRWSAAHTRCAAGGSQRSICNTWRAGGGPPWPRPPPLGVGVCVLAALQRCGGRSGEPAAVQAPGLGSANMHGAQSACTAAPQGREGKVTQVYRRKWVIHIERITREKVNGESGHSAAHGSSSARQTSGPRSWRMSILGMAWRGPGEAAARKKRAGAGSWRDRHGFMLCAYAVALSSSPPLQAPL